MTLIDNNVLGEEVKIDAGGNHAETVPLSHLTSISSISEFAKSMTIALDPNDPLFVKVDVTDGVTLSLLKDEVSEHKPMSQELFGDVSKDQLGDDL